MIQPKVQEHLEVLGQNRLEGVESVYLIIVMIVLTGAAGAYGIGQVKADWRVFGESVLCLGSLGMAIILIMMATTNSIIIGYIGHVLYALVYNAMMTIAK